MKNPINATVNCLPGQQLPANWKAQAGNRAAAAEADYLNRLQNAWRHQQEPRQTQSLTRDARLTQDRADGGRGGPQERFDGRMVLIEQRADGMELWRDETTGFTVWRRLSWNDICGQK